MTGSLFSSDRTVVAFFRGLRFTISSASVMSLLSIVSVTVYGFPVPSSLCLVCVCVRMCEQVSVGV